MLNFLLLLWFLNSPNRELSVHVLQSTTAQKLRQLRLLQLMPSFEVIGAQKNITKWANHFRSSHHFIPIHLIALILLLNVQLAAILASPVESLGLSIFVFLAAHLLYPFVFLTIEDVLQAGGIGERRDHGALGWVHVGQWGGDWATSRWPRWWWWWVLVDDHASSATELGLCGWGGLSSGSKSDGLAMVVFSTVQ